MRELQTREGSPAIHTFTRLVLGLLVALTAAIAIGAWPTWRLAGSGGVTAMFVGSAITLVGGLVGSCVNAFGMAQRPEMAGYTTMAAASARFVLTLAAALVLTLCTDMPEKPLLLWVVISYLAVLAGETASLVRLIGKREMHAAK